MNALNREYMEKWMEWSLGRLHWLVSHRGYSISKDEIKDLHHNNYLSYLTARPRYNPDRGSFKTYFGAIIEGNLKTCVSKKYPKMNDRYITFSRLNQPAFDDGRPFEPADHSVLQDKAYEQAEAARKARRIFLKAAAQCSVKGLTRLAQIKIAAKYCAGYTVEEIAKGRKLPVCLAARVIQEIKRVLSL